MTDGKEARADQQAPPVEVEGSEKDDKTQAGLLGVGPGAGAEASSTESLGDELYRLDFGVHKSLRYHSMRRRFLDLWHRISMSCAVVSAAAAYAAVTGAWPEVSTTVALLAASMTLLDVVVGFSQRARTHEQLYRRFSDLAAEIARVPHRTDEQVREWMAERLMIQADEPPSLDALNVMCHNLEVEARGLGDEHKWRLSWWHRRFPQWFAVIDEVKPHRAAG
jgi:hypothetical protein